MPHSGTIRFVNRSQGVLRFPSPRGNRIALSPGEFTTDKYYERFARVMNTPNTGGRKPLVMEYTDGTPVGVDELPEEDGIRRPVSTLVQPPRAVRPQAVPPPAGCETSCEVACQFPAESTPHVADQINAGMNKPVEDPTPPLADQPTTEALTPADTMLGAEQALEPGIAPPMPSAAPTTSKALTATTTSSPPPTVNEAVFSDGDKLSVKEIMEQFDLNDQDILEVSEDYVKIRLDGKEEYASRFQVGWTTVHLSSMKSHITKQTPNV